MATLRLDIATFSFSKTISTAHLGRLNVAARTYFSMPSNATDEQVATQVASWLWGHLTGLTKQVEQQVAAKTAGDAVTDIAIT